MSLIHTAHDIMKILYNGSLLYSNNENIPNTIPGYVVDGSNCKLFHLKYLPCLYRCNHKKKLPCGKIKIYDTCNLKNCLVSRLFCSQCKDRKE